MEIVLIIWTSLQLLKEIWERREDGFKGFVLHFCQLFNNLDILRFISFFTAGTTHTLAEGHVSRLCSTYRSVRQHRGRRDTNKHL